MGKLDGKVAIVTGGGRGIGRAIAEGYAREAARVVVTAARERGEIDGFAALWGGERALAILADVTDPAACERVVTETVARFGRLDVLVNNAGRGMKYVSPRFLTEPTRFWEVEPAVWRMVIDTNVNGPFFMARAAVRHMLGYGAGAIINVSMNYETMKRRGFSPYAPSKAALESETIIWAQDLEGTGITVNEILPGGATATGMIPPGIPEELRQRLLSPEIVVPLAVFLASEAARTLTGRRLVATEWSLQRPEGHAASSGIGD
ncbi:MAG TPA: SDR family oxidoreductase [Syntrophobacteria bacterium]|nr:SDR family oxidoreductase [Syntrophobacteria bacterium]